MNAALKGEKGAPVYLLRLYVAGPSYRSRTALENIERICEEYLPDQCRIEVVDLLKSPDLAKTDQIVAIPTLVRKLPSPSRRVIGDLSNTQRVLTGLDLQPRKLTLETKKQKKGARKPITR